MPLLSSSIVRQRLATMEQVEEALARQSAEGGDLLTNLLERVSVSEDRVSAALAESFGIEPAPVGELPRAAERVRRLVPADVATRFACYPLDEQGGLLTLAVSEPLPPDVESDLGFGLGVNIVQRVAPLVRIRQAVARDYGLVLDERVGRALARLEGRAEPGDSFSRHAELAPERPDTIAPAPQPVAPEPAPAVEVPVVQPAPARSASELKAFVRAVRPPRSRGPKPRRLGPYTAAMAENDLVQAGALDEVLESFFNFVEQYFEYAALFAVHGDLAEGRDAHGPGASRAKVQSIGVSLDLPSSLRRARDESSHLLTRLAGSGLDGAFAKDLERRPGATVLLLPVCVRGRCLLLLYGDHGDVDVDLASVGDVISYAPLVAAAIERLIVQRKRGRAESTALGSLAPKPQRKAPLPSHEERAQALAGALQRKSLAPAEPRHAEPPAQPLAPIDAPPEPRRITERVPPPAAELESLGPEPGFESFLEVEPPRSVRPATSEPPASQAHARPLAPTLGAPATTSSNPPRSIAEALARPVIPVGRASDRPTDPAAAPVRTPVRQGSLPPSAIDAGWEELSGSSSPFALRERGTRPGVGSLPPVAPASLTAPVAETTPELLVESGPVDDEVAAIAADTRWSEVDSPGVPLASMSRTAAHSARPLPHPREDSDEQALPSVIVDVAQDCRTLLDQLLQGDVSAGDRLVAAGAPGIAVLVAAFPGPLETPSSRRPNPGLGRASDAGPVLRTLARIGARAVPFLVVRTNDASADVRGYATRLLGEIATPESAQAIARRFFDGDVEVRRAALSAARLLANSQEAINALVTELGVTAEDRVRPTSVRLTAMEALAELRQPQAVPYLILALDDNPVDVVQSARRALVVLARQDFGTSTGAWSDWWERARGRHRIEWLIDALTHDAGDIRRPAGEELKALTREYFGYYDDLPAAERAQAQRQYRQWWETRGKIRFRA
ncbi:MAG TPA: HEAT repeat domain-containing protein [Polyangiaceae bacterium]|nr:HEAT repeat domain-containing protein [Polyangiaceae bacterium]